MEPQPQPQPVPIACSLSPNDGQRQLGEWNELVAAATSVDELANGVRISAPIPWADAARDLAAREASCCSFLDISTATTADAVVVTVTSPDPEAVSVARILAGLGAPTSP